MNAVKCAVKLDVLRPGDWIEMKHGHERRMYYVISNDPMGQILRYGSLNWCVSSFNSETYAELRNDMLEPLRGTVWAEQFEPNITYLGRTKKRWWRKFVPFRDLVCPFHPFKFN